MINQSQVLKTASDAKAYVKAFREYCEDRTKLWSEMMALVQNTIVYGGELTSSNVPVYIESFGSINPEAYIPLPTGSIKVKDLVLNINTLINSDGFNEEDILDQPLPLLSLNTGNTVNVTVQDVLIDLQSSLHSVVTMAAGAAAMSYDVVSERVAYFREYVSRTFKNSYEDISSTGNFIVDVLERVTDPADYISNMATAMGISNEPDPVSFTDIAETDIYQYSGASPMGPLDFGSVAKTVGTVLNTGRKMVTAVFNGLWKIGKSIFSKAVSFVTTTFVDPYDLEQLDNGVKNHLIDGFSYDISGKVLSFKEYSDDTIPDTTARDLFVKDWILSRGWMKLDLKTGVVLFKATDLVFDSYWTDYDVEDGEGNVENTYHYRDITIIGSVLFQPKPINARFVNVPLSSIVPLQTFVGRQNFVSNVISDLDSLTYRNLKDSESRLFASYRDSLIATQNVLLAALMESTVGGSESTAMGSNVYSWPLLPNMHTSYLNDIGNPAAPTNLDWVRVASGYDGTNFTIGHDGWSSLFNILYMQAITRYNTPLNYMFLPYTRETAVKDPGMYKIKTDDDNYQAFNKFVTMAIIVAVVAVVAISAFVVVRKIAMKSVLKVSALERSVGDKILNGTVTNADLKQLRKARLVSKLLGASSASMVGGVSSSTLIQNIGAKSNDGIIALINS